jgi:hypothetical protein
MTKEHIAISHPPKYFACFDENAYGPFSWSQILDAESISLNLTRSYAISRKTDELATRQSEIACEFTHSIAPTDEKQSES